MIMNGEKDEIQVHLLNFFGKGERELQEGRLLELACRPLCETTIFKKIYLHPTSNCKVQSLGLFMEIVEDLWRSLEISLTALYRLRRSSISERLDDGRVSINSEKFEFSAEVSMVAAKIITARTSIIMAGAV